MPLAFIFETIKEVSKAQHARANSEAWPTLYLLGKAHGLGGGKQLTLKDYLPYPDQSDRLSQRTAEIIGALLDADKLPQKVIMSMGKYLDQIP